MECPDLIVQLADRFPPCPPGFAVSEVEAERTAERRLKVLVVDDERLLADTTTAILHRAGFDVRTAYDGFGALEMTGSFHPDYLMTDIMMPGMNGVDLAMAVAKMYPAIAILLVSGQAGIADILDECKARGFEFPLLAKPVHPSNLVEKLRHLRKD
jgi:CheY-like chemotaxis protein